jgi:DnaJ-class molecular chaperone
MNTNTRQQRGDNIEQPVTLSLQEAYSGTSRTFNIQSTVYCPNCNGRGYGGSISSKVCSNCNGKGTVESNKRIQVKIPTGVDNGSRIRVAGEGQPGIGGAPRGDLFLVISVKPDSFYERRGNDLYCKVEVEQAIALSGGKVPIPLPDGEQ